MTYIISSGRRWVFPYLRTLKTYVKARWKGRKLGTLFTGDETHAAEFVAWPPQYFVSFLSNFHVSYLNKKSLMQ